KRLERPLGNMSKRFVWRRRANGWALRGTPLKVSHIWPGFGARTYSAGPSNRSMELRPAIMLGISGEADERTAARRKCERCVRRHVDLWQVGHVRKAVIFPDLC